ncbi:MAG: hypothetical protein ABI408_07080 [Gemmatimonadaceae bacterium]
MKHFPGIGVKRIAWMVSFTAAACEAGNQRQPSTSDTGSLARQVTASPVQRSAACGDEIVTDEAVGTLRIGMSVASLGRECTVLGDTTALGAEGMPSRRVAVLFPRDTLEAEIVDDKVWRIEIQSPRFATADSLHVGTPLTRLLRLRNPRGMTGEGQLFVVSPDHCGLSFRLTNAGSPILKDPTPTTLARMPANTAVAGILIIGCR